MYALLATTRLSCVPRRKLDLSGGSSSYYTRAQNLPPRTHRAITFSRNDPARVTSRATRRRPRRRRGQITVAALVVGGVLTAKDIVRLGPAGLGAMVPRSTPGFSAAVAYTRIRHA